MQLVELREAELEDHVQHAIHALGLDVEILHRGGEPAEHVQPLDEVEVGRHDHVATAGVGQQPFEPLEVERISRVGRSEPLQGRPIGQGMVDDLAHILGVGPPPAAAPVVGRSVVEEPAGRGPIHLPDVAHVVRRPGHFVLPERQPRRMAKLDRPADYLTGVHPAYSSGSLTGRPPAAAERSIAMHSSWVL